MSLKLQGYIRRVGPTHPVDRAVMLALAEWIDDRNLIPETYPYLHELCDSTGFRRTTVIESLARLQGEGWLTITKCGQHSPSIYQVNRVKPDLTCKPADTPYHRVRPTPARGTPDGPLKTSRGTPDGCLKPAQTSATRTSATFRHTPDGPLKASRGTPDGPLHNGTRARLPLKTPLIQKHPLKAPSPQAATGHGGLSHLANGHAKDDPIRNALADFANHTHIRDRGALRAIREVLKAEVRDQDDTPYNIASRMSDAWEKFTESLPLMRFQWGPKHFFTTGAWRDQRRWPYDKQKFALWKEAQVGVVH